ncbi:hypothetical protein EVAR_55382_1 [Eumeta japonica]|uniref:Uncharacterized protein n=1 Tax=Eumeta variegata TaxID=151549 RepID=A0A4C1YNJ3_EUMVA|nr:hypothetical protein EVAR_55382_1 [Eumeta japonica]
MRETIQCSDFKTISAFGAPHTERLIAIVNVDETAAAGGGAQTYGGKTCRNMIDDERFIESRWYNRVDVYQRPYWSLSEAAPPSDPFHLQLDRGRRRRRPRNGDRGPLFITDPLVNRSFGYSPALRHSPSGENRIPEVSRVGGHHRARARS